MENGKYPKRTMEDHESLPKKVRLQDSILKEASTQTGRSEIELLIENIEK